jgi:hypothetical protein
LPGWKGAALNALLRQTEHSYYRLYCCSSQLSHLSTLLILSCRVRMHSTLTRARSVMGWSYLLLPLSRDEEGVCLDLKCDRESPRCESAL